MTWRNDEAHASQQLAVDDPTVQVSWLVVMDNDEPDPHASRSRWEATVCGLHYPLFLAKIAQLPFELEPIHVVPAAFWERQLVEESVTPVLIEFSIALTSLNDVRPRRRPLELCIEFVRCRRQVRLTN